LEGIRQAGQIVGLEDHSIAARFTC
jgi:hypothetical protein